MSIVRMTAIIESDEASYQRANYVLGGPSFHRLSIHSKESPPKNPARFAQPPSASVCWLFPGRRCGAKRARGCGGAQERSLQNEASSVPIYMRRYIPRPERSKPRGVWRADPPGKKERQSRRLMTPNKYVRSSAGLHVARFIWAFDQQTEV
jgi:hypothetical protein